MSARPARHAAALGKLASPRLGRVFDRERLFGVLDGASEAPAVWLAAPPGAGKTTLVATWLRRRAIPTLWLQLDAGDADPATFMQSLDALWSSLLPAPLQLPALRADDLADLPAWLRRRLLRVLPLLPAGWTLVFDNQQELPAASPLQDALAHALVHLPAGVQWIFISREPPPAPFTGALAKQQLAFIGAEPLRLDEAETRALIRLHGRAESIASSLAVAQGWAAGLTLMLLGAPRDAKLPTLDAHERLFDYFAGEVLSRMPADHQQALGMLAYLPSTTAPLALAMSGCAEAPALLEQLAASSLFTDRREGPPAVFVFHALFAQFLRRRFERAASIEQQSALLLRAGRLLIGAGETDAGLQRLIEAQAWDEAVQAIAQNAPRYAADGRVQALRGHIHALPAAHAERLAYWRGWCALDSAPALALADMAQAERDGAATQDAGARLAAAAGAATALVSTGRVRELDPWIELLTAHADQVLAAHDDDTQMRLVPGLLSALVYRRPWHALTEALAERAERLLHHESAAGQRLLIGALVFHLLWRGHVDRLERIVLRIDALCAQGLAAPATMLRWWGVGTLVKTLLGHTASARADAQQALALIDAEPALAPQRAGARAASHVRGAGFGRCRGGAAAHGAGGAGAAPRQRLRPHHLRTPARHAGAARRRHAHCPAPDARRGGERARQRLCRCANTSRSLPTRWPRLTQANPRKRSRRCTRCSRTLCSPPAAGTTGWAAASRRTRRCCAMTNLACSTTCARRCRWLASAATGMGRCSSCAAT